MEGEEEPDRRTEAGKPGENRPGSEEEASAAPLPTSRVTQGGSDKHLLCLALGAETASPGTPGLTHQAGTTGSAGGAADRRLSAGGSQKKPC